MWHLPRIALGALQPEARHEPVLWGLLSLLNQAGQTPQTFLSRSAYIRHDGLMTVAGRATRHLDNWQMNRVACLRTLRRGARGADIAIVEGRFDDRVSSEEPPPDVSRGGSLAPLCQWFDLAKIGVLDLHRAGCCSIPKRPTKLDGVILDRIARPEDGPRWQVEIEALWGVPVLGWLDEAAPLRAVAEGLSPGVKPSPELCRRLGERLASSLRLDRLWNLAHRSALPGVSPYISMDGPPTRRLQVAVAYDEGFSRHFPDTLDQLEAMGAIIRDFSPLRNESLPDRTDLVYLGCGHIDEHLETLASNHCLKQALRCFAASGGRIYAEGSGLAYLCRQAVLPDGRTANMAGLLPATARRTDDMALAEPMEIAFGASCWLADARTKMRGYRGCGWQIEPTGAMLSYARNPQCRCDVLGRGNVLGSRISVNFAAQPHLLRRFFSPYVPVSRALQL